jgi:hypothetical protein
MILSPFHTFKNERMMEETTRTRSGSVKKNNESVRFKSKGSFQPEVPTYFRTEMLYRVAVAERELYKKDVSNVNKPTETF